ncbi:MAG: B12-binding domain-containing protein [Synergistales bacterium]|nr:B12-binding domain-containing protein [Synergistales bacterium]
MEQRSQTFREALLAMERDHAHMLAESGFDTSNPLEFIETVMVPALESIGQGWEQGTVSLSQVYMSGRICETIIDNLLPSGSVPARPHPPMALAVLEDFHMLGKRLVGSVLKANRFDPFDYGQIQTEDLVSRVLRDRIEILLLSTLMLPSALQVKEVLRLLTEEEWKGSVIVGGAPFRFDDQLWREVGADATAHRASDVPGILSRFEGVSS